MNSRLLFLSLLLALIACSDENAIETQPIPDIQANFVQTRFDLQDGFSNKRVRIQIDSVVHFNAYLSGIVSFTGPEAYFVSFLTRSQHCLIVMTGIPVVSADTLLLPLGNSQSYYVGLRLASEICHSIALQDFDHKERSDENSGLLCQLVFDRSFCGCTNKHE
jgi:hypothetical protein